jgi:diguanylate cyclase (GGDEF)-like protein/PAS domain S-box-containing protein
MIDDAKPTAPPQKGLRGLISPKRKEEPWEGSRTGALKTTVVLLIAIAISDRLLVPHIPISVLYVMPILTSVWMRNRRMIFATACLASLLVGLDLLATESFAPGTSKFMPFKYAFSAAGVSLFILWTTVSMGLMWLGVQRDLVRSQQTTSQTLTNLAEGVVTVDQDDQIVLMNPAAERMTGWRLAEAKGRPVNDIVRRERDVILIPGNGAPQGEGEVLVSRDGTMAPVEVSAATFEIDEETSGLVLVLSDASERRDREGVMLRLAYRDRLTGLPNRASLSDRMGLELAHSRRSGLLLGFLFLDLDGLKQVNDTLGHAAGDALLVGFADRLGGVLREGDTVARLGGDEFTVLLPNLEDASSAGIVAEKILISLKQPIIFEGHNLNASISIGIALFPDHGITGEEVLERADEAMYMAKEAGGQQYCYWMREVATPV